MANKKQGTVFPKFRLLTFERYAHRRDLLTALLDEGKEYTFEQVDKLLDDFLKKGKVS